MGCTLSIPTIIHNSNNNNNNNKNKKKKKKETGSSIGPSFVAVFVPTLWLPEPVDLPAPLHGLVPSDVLDRLCSARARIVELANRNVHSAVAELQQALEEYLPLLLGLTRIEHSPEVPIEFKWKNLECGGKEMCFGNAWFEVLTVVHLMAMLALVEANSLLLPQRLPDSCDAIVSEESKKDVITLLLKASGYLDYCVHHVMIRLPLHIREKLPYDLHDGVIEAISVQALGQCVEMQLGLAIASEQATLSVKRRLACELVIYYSQAYYCLSGSATDGSYGKKYLQFVKWKYLEAKAAAYYYHGLLLEKKNGPDNHVSAVNSFLASDELLTESKKVCLSFCLALPVTRVPPPWGAMKHLRNKIPELASQKYEMFGYLFEQEKTLLSLPDLPEFSLSLKPDVYDLPKIDSSWKLEACQSGIQSLEQHLTDDEGIELELMQGSSA